MIISKDNKNIFSVCESGRIINWDIEAMKIVENFNEQGCSSCLEISNNGKYLASGSKN